MTKSERPRAIVAFEALTLASVLLFMLLTHTDTPFWDLFDDTIAVVLALWVSRGRSRIARVIYTFVVLLAFVVIGLTLGLQLISSVPSLTLMTSALLELVLLALLWWPSVTAWLNSLPQQAVE